MNTTQDRPTIPVPAASLSDAALMADYRSRNRLTVAELAELTAGTSLELSAKEEAEALRAQARWTQSKKGSY